MIEAYFTNIKEEIKRNIISAQSSIKICMAWFTDEEIMQALCKKVRDGLFVELILLDHSSNRNEPRIPGVQDLGGFKISLSEFSNIGGRVFLIDNDLEFFLHSKFCIIDDLITITGSYNWSFKARNSIENIVVIADGEIAKKFKEEYERIRDHKIDLVAERFLLGCPACGGKMFNARIFDLTEYTFAEQKFQDVRFCSSNPSEHLSILNLGEEHTYFAEIIESECERYEDLQIDINKESLNSNIESIMASHFNSRSDLFSISICDDILMVGCIQDKLDRFGDDYLSIEFYWCHDIVKPFQKTISDFEDEVIEKLFSI